MLSDAYEVWESAYGHKFSDVLPKLCPESHLTSKQSKAELKKQNRQKERKLVTHIGKEIAKDATIVTVGTGESFAQYNRKKDVYVIHKDFGPSQTKEALTK